jgi:hypothetical protein
LGEVDATAIRFFDGERRAGLQSDAQAKDVSAMPIECSIGREPAGDQLPAQLQDWNMADRRDADCFAAVQADQTGDDQR